MIIDVNEGIERVAAQVYQKQKELRKIDKLDRKKKKKLIKSKKKSSKKEIQQSEEQGQSIDKDKKEESSSISSESSYQENLRILAMKDAIMIEQKRSLKALSKKFKKNTNFDVKMSGKCCCSNWTNEQAGVLIHIVDVIFFPNILRWLVALWFTCDKSRLMMYANARKFTCWLFWILMAGMATIQTVTTVMAADNPAGYSLFLSLLILMAILFCFILDYHYSKVFLIYANNYPKMQERLKKEEADRLEQIRLDIEQEEKERLELEELKKHKSILERVLALNPPADDKVDLEN